jgi:hypothetical protein
MKLLIPVVIIVALVAFAVGVNVKNSFISPFNLALDKNALEQQSQAEIEAAKGNLPKISGEAGPAASVPGNSSTHTQNGNTYTSTSSDSSVTVSGKYMLSSYKMNFTFTLPKKGGDITGNVTGTCEGSIKGRAQAPDSDNESEFEGEYSGDCKPIPTLSFKTHASGVFKGVAKFKENKDQITVYNKEPFSTGGSWFELFF